MTWGQTDEFLEGEWDLSIETLPVEPESKLWIAVLLRAWADAFLDSDFQLISVDKTVDPDGARAAARNWLTLNFGDWREDREAVCSLAGLDPDFVRMAALRRLERARGEDVERMKRERIAIDQAFEKLAREEVEVGQKRARQRLRVLVKREERLG